MTVCVRTVCGGAEERQTKQSDMAQWIVYNRRTPKVSGRREVYCWWSFYSVRSVSPLSNIYGFLHHVGIL